ncbi:MAG: hypothetical protein KC550_04840 [Nanoarchaeota archaeon]|nr:hypothetical protein [Nanoarchaeota archaeon]
MRYFSNYNFFENIIINNSYNGIHLDSEDVTFNNFTNINVQNSLFNGLLLAGASNNIFLNSTIKENSNYDVAVTDKFGA